MFGFFRCTTKPTPAQMGQASHAAEVRATIARAIAVTIGAAEQRYAGELERLQDPEAGAADLLDREMGRTNHDPEDIYAYRELIKLGVYDLVADRTLRMAIVKYVVNAAFVEAAEEFLGENHSLLTIAEQAEDEGDLVLEAKGFPVLTERVNVISRQIAAIHDAE